MTTRDLSRLFGVDSHNDGKLAFLQFASVATSVSDRLLSSLPNRRYCMGTLIGVCDATRKILETEFDFIFLPSLVWRVAPQTPMSAPNNVCCAG